MTSNQNHKNKWENITLKSLEAQLRTLPEVEVPETLKARLFAVIGGSKPATGPAARHRFGAWTCVVAAAAVFLALILVSRHSPFAPAPSLIRDLNNSCPNMNANPPDLNETAINLSKTVVHYVMADQNNIGIDRGILYQLQCPIVSRNEYGYRN